MYLRHSVLDVIDYDKFLSELDFGICHIKSWLRVAGMAKYLGILQRMRLFLEFPSRNISFLPWLKT